MLAWIQSRDERSACNLTPRVRGLVTILATAAGLVALLLGLQAPTADASSQGCTYTRFPDKYVCFNIEGRGTHVDEFVVIRGKPSAENDICNFSAQVRVTAPNGQVWIYKSGTRGGCELVRATRTFKVNRNYPSGSRACGSFYENGELQDTACNKIHS